MCATPFVGRIVNGQVDFKTIVMASDSEEAKSKILEKYSNDIGTMIIEDDIEVYPFF